jgi:hypothetical protein
METPATKSTKNVWLEKLGIPLAFMAIGAIIFVVAKPKAKKSLSIPSEV